MHVRFLLVLSCLVSVNCPGLLLSQVVIKDHYSDEGGQLSKDNGIIPTTDIHIERGYTIEIYPYRSRGGSLTDPHEMAEYHIVQRGQTLYRIGQIYNVSVEKIQQLNGIHNTVIFPGQKLLIRKRKVPEVQYYDQQAQVVPASSSSVRYTQTSGSGSTSHQNSSSGSSYPANYQMGAYENTHAGQFNYETQQNADAYVMSDKVNPMFKSRREDLPVTTAYGPKLRTLHIGVSQYQDVKIPPLRFARNDAIQMRHIWKMQQGKTFGTADCQLLSGAQTTYHEILNAISNLGKGTTSQDLIVISISGHAIVVNNELRILPSDYFLNVPEHNYLTTSSILKALNKDYARILLILDVCYSGQAGYDFAPLLNENKQVAVFASSRSDERSTEHITWQHGAFTRAMLEGAYGYADINQDSWISLTELQFYIQSRVRDITHNSQHANSPINFLGDIILFRHIK